MKDQSPSSQRLCELGSDSGMVLRLTWLDWPGSEVVEWHGITRLPIYTFFGIWAHWRLVDVAHVLNAWWRVSVCGPINLFLQIRLIEVFDCVQRIVFQRTKKKKTCTSPLHLSSSWEGLWPFWNLFFFLPLTPQEIVTKSFSRLVSFTSPPLFQKNNQADEETLMCCVASKQMVSTQERELCKVCLTIAFFQSILDLLNKRHFFWIQKQESLISNLRWKASIQVNGSWNHLNLYPVGHDSTHKKRKEQDDIHFKICTPHNRRQRYWNWFRSSAWVINLENESWDLNLNNKLDNL